MASHKADSWLLDNGPVTQIDQTIRLGRERETGQHGVATVSGGNAINLKTKHSFSFGVGGWEKVLHAAKKRKKEKCVFRLPGQIWISFNALMDGRIVCCTSAVCHSQHNKRKTAAISLCVAKTRKTGDISGRTLKTRNLKSRKDTFGENRVSKCVQRTTLTPSKWGKKIKNYYSKMSSHIWHFQTLCRYARASNRLAAKSRLMAPNWIVDNAFLPPPNKWRHKN